MFKILFVLCCSMHHYTQHCHSSVLIVCPAYASSIMHTIHFKFLLWILVYCVLDRVIGPHSHRSRQWRSNTNDTQQTPHRASGHTHHQNLTPPEQSHHHSWRNTQQHVQVTLISAPDCFEIQHTSSSYKANNGVSWAKSTNIRTAS